MTARQTVRMAHASMQFSDTARQKRRDVDRIFKRALKRNLSWFTGTEAGEPDLWNLIVTAAEKHGFVLHRYRSNWIAVRKAHIVVRTVRKGHRFIAKTSEVVGHGHDSAFPFLTFQHRTLGPTAVAGGHYPTKGRAPKDPNHHINRMYARELGDWGDDMRAKGALVFYGGDQNMLDTGDTFFGEKFETCWDALNKHPNTGHGNIDVLAFYNDDRIRWTSAQAFDDRSEFPLHTDHFFIEAEAAVRVSTSVDTTANIPAPTPPTEPEAPMSNAQIYPGSNVTTQWFAKRFPGAKMNVNVGVIHTTEGTSWPSYGGGGSAPTLTAMPNIKAKRLDWRQHFPFDMSARALRNTSGGVETNTLNAVQVELIGTCDPRHAKTWNGAKAGVDYIYWPDAPEWALRDLAEFIAWAHTEHGVRLQSTVTWKAYPGSYGNSDVRLTGVQWRNYYGWCGHQHVPENSHGDPGDIDFAKVLEFARALVGEPDITVPEAPVGIGGKTVFVDAFLKADNREEREDAALLVVRHGSPQAKTAAREWLDSRKRGDAAIAALKTLNKGA